MVYQNSVISLHLKGHQGNVYDLEWNKNEGGEGWRLLSCGADCTARVWNDSNDVVLSHPAYVYSARFGESDDRVVTGCFDQLIRLWELNSSSPRLISTYVQHRAPINSLCWDSHGRLFSADAKGSICVWNSTISGLHFEKYFLFFIVILRDNYYTFLSSSINRILNESSEEYRNETPINCLCFHPSGGRLLVHYRGSEMCLLEPKSGLKLISYSGIYNPRYSLIG